VLSVIPIITLVSIRARTRCPEFRHRPQRDLWIGCASPVDQISGGTSRPIPRQPSVRTAERQPIRSAELHPIRLAELRPIRSSVRFAAELDPNGKVVSSPADIVHAIPNTALLVAASPALLILTIAVNLMANFVAPIYALTNLFPERLNFARAGLVSAVIGVVILPWNLYNSPVVINYFLGGLGALLGPLFGIIIADYRRRLPLSPRSEPACDSGIRARRRALPVVRLPAGAARCVRVRVVHRRRSGGDHPLRTRRSQRDVRRRLGRIDRGRERPLTG
jgi:hypothetical protein